MQLAPLVSLAPVPVPAPAGPVLAEFNYVIRGPQSMPHIGHIDAQAWPSTGVALASGTSFEDAVAAAKAIAAKAQYDGIHGLPIQQAQGLMRAADGTYTIVPLGGFHRETTGPLFVDGRFFEAAALSLQVVRKTRELVAVVGAERLLDLRQTGAAFVTSANTNPPVPR